MKYPASMTQRQHWLAHQLAPQSTAYALPAVFRCTGRVDVEKLRKSIQLTVARHESLRTRLLIEDDGLYQVVEASFELDIPVVDVRESARSGDDSHQTGLIAATVSSRFDLERDSPVRARIIRIADDQLLLVIVMHHAVSDLETLRLFLDEVSARYNSIGEYAETDPAKTYIQYSQWQREWLKSEEYIRMLGYWRQELRDAIGCPCLAADYDRPAAWTAHGRDELVQIPRELSEAVRSTSAALKVNTFTLLLAAYCLLLHRYGMERETIVGVPFTNRRQDYSAEIFGSFANILPIVMQIDDHADFADIVKRLRWKLLLAHRNQEVPLEMIVRETHPKRSPGSNPIYQVGFTQEPELRLALQGVQTRREHVSKGSSQLDIYAFFRHDEGRNLTGHFEYNTDIFSEQTMHSFASDYVVILAAAARQPATAARSITVARSHVPSRSNTESVSPGAPAGPTQEVPCQAYMAATFTAEPIVPILEFWFHQWRWPITVKSTEYNQLFQQLLDSKSGFRSNTDGYNICLVRLDDWLGGMEVGAGEADRGAATAALAGNAGQFLDSIAAAISGAHVRYIIVICPPSPGLRSATGIYESVLWVKEDLERRLRNYRDVTVISWEQIEHWYPVTDWYQGEGEEFGHTPYTDHYYVAMASALARVIASHRRSPYKAVVVDCDGTIWTGVLGEDGIRGIRIDGGYAEVQRQLLEVRSRGMALCMCSKNDEQEVMNVLRYHPDMLLKPEHFTLQRINWLPKSQNVRQIAEILNIGLDSMIFIDDNPVECAEVEANLPDVFTIRLPQDSRTAARAIGQMWAFDVPPATREDSRRAELYQKETQRGELKRRSLSFAEFIADLNLVIRIAPAVTEHVPRISQLTIRTNQFNAAGTRLTESQVGVLLGDPSIACFTVQVADRFGDYGLVGVMIARQAGQTLTVQNIILSCRALGRGVEHRMLSHLGSFAVSSGLDIVECRCAKTEKNEPIRGFFRQVCGAYGVDSETGILYRVPTVVAASIAFNPDDAGQSHPIPKGRENEGGMKRTGIRVGENRALMLRIMNDMNDVVAIGAAVRASRMGDAQRRQPETTPYELASITATEKKLVEIWKDVLAVQSVGIHENFFDAGGASIQMPSVAFQIRRALDVKISLVDLFQYPTISTLARHLSHPESSDGDLDSMATKGRRQRAMVGTQQLPVTFERLKRHRGK